MFLNLTNATIGKKKSLDDISNNNFNNESNQSKNKNINEKNSESELTQSNNCSSCDTSGKTSFPISNNTNNNYLHSVRSIEDYNNDNENSNNNNNNNSNNNIDYYDLQTGEKVNLEKNSNKIIVKFDGLDDKENALNWSLLRKWTNVIICAICAVNVTCLSSIYSSTFDNLMNRFGNSREVVTVGITLYLLGMGLGPMFFSPMSEFYGRKPIYVGSFTFFLAMQFATAFSPTIEGVLIPRFFQGIGGSAFLSVAGGTVSDIFTVQTMGKPMLLFTMAPFLGPSLGPLIGGFININVSWRWTFHVCIIWTFVLLLCLIFIVSETYQPVLLKRKAIRLRNSTGNENYLAPIELENKAMLNTIFLSCHRPFSLLIFEPMIASLCLYTAILLGILYLFFEAFPVVYSQVYDFKLQYVGLAFCGILIGDLSNWIIQPFITGPMYEKLVAKNNGVTQPEFRLVHSMVGAILTTAGLFWFAFTLYSHVHWIVSIIASAFYAAGMILVFTGVFTYLVEGYKSYAASALGANSFVRSVVGCVFPLFGVQMYHRLGVNWASALLAFLTLACVPLPFAFFIYGARIRAKSRFTKPP